MSAFLLLTTHPLHYTMTDMSTNFDFLQKVDKDLFEIIIEAEKLYRDEYFEQCMTQTRRFAENVCKKVLGNNRSFEDTFDDMLATLKDNISGEIQEKEFVDDLYFLKKNGNVSTHSAKVKKDGVAALECLQRAFEAAVNYAVYNRNANPDVLRLRYDTELLLTGKKSTKSLSERYAEEKAYNNRNKIVKQAKSPATAKKKKVKSQSYQMTPSKKRKGISVFLILLGITTSISLGLIVILSVMIITR